MAESFSATEQLSIKLPAWPPAEALDLGYPELSGWQLSLFTSRESDTFFLPPDTSSLEKKILKSDILIALARPVTLSSDKNFETLFFMPAGNFYPQFYRNGELQLLWKDGYASEIMKSILLNSEKDGYSKDKAVSFLKNFNWKRFSHVISEKSRNDEFYNPWKLDFEKTVTALTSGSFTSTRLNLKPGTEISYNGKYSGSPLSPYIPENLKIFDKQTIPVYSKQKNYFYIEDDLLLIAFSEDSKKVSETVTFMPKKTIETVYAKTN